MRTQNGQNVCTNCNSATHDVKPVSKISTMLFPSQVNLLNRITSCGLLELIDSLETIHDLALYHSHAEINEHEKIALLDVETLWEALEQMVEEV